MNINHSNRRYLLIPIRSEPNTQTRTNERSTLIDLIFSQQDQTITKMTTSAPLGKSHHKTFRYRFIVNKNLKNERPSNLYTIVPIMAV